MLGPVYVGLSAQSVLKRKVETIAYNIANSATPGFRADQVRFEELVSKPAGMDALIQQSLLSEADEVMGRYVSSADGSIGGYVRSVSFDTENLIAHLDNGRSLPLTSGVVVS